MTDDVMNNPWRVVLLPPSAVAACDGPPADFTLQQRLLHLIVALTAVRLTARSNSAGRSPVSVANPCSCV